jgi:hypothetical protein
MLEVIAKALFPTVVFSALPLNFCQKKQEIQAVIFIDE